MPNKRKPLFPEGVMVERMMPPPEKQDAQVVDNQRNRPILFLESLPPPGGVGVLTSREAV